MVGEGPNVDVEAFSFLEVLNQNSKLNIVVTKDLFQKILEESGTKIDFNGFLVDAITEIREKSNSEDEIAFIDLGVLSAGSKVFIQKNIASFSEFLVARNKNSSL